MAGAWGGRTLGDTGLPICCGDNCCCCLLMMTTGVFDRQYGGVVFYMTDSVYPCRLTSSQMLPGCRMTRETSKSGHGGWGEVA